MTRHTGRMTQIKVAGAALAGLSQIDASDFYLGPRTASMENVTADYGRITAFAKPQPSHTKRAKVKAARKQRRRQK